MRIVQDHLEQRVSICLKSNKFLQYCNIIEKSLKLSFKWQHPSSKGEKHIISELDLV